MIAYLWAGEPGLAGEYQRNLFLDQIRPDGSFEGTETPWAQHLAMYASAAADLPTCFGGIGPRAGEAFRRAAAFVHHLLRTFDPEGSGLLSVRSSENVIQQTFWGIAFGKLPNFPPNYDGKAKSIAAGLGVGRLLQTPAGCGAGVWRRRSGPRFARRRPTFDQRH